MSISRLIKSERQRKGIKQINLAKGICSVSYLSKIENDNISPNKDVLELLLKRLNITKENVENSNNSKLVASLKNSYKNIIINRIAPELNVEELPEYYFDESHEINVEYCIYLIRILLSKELYSKAEYLLELIDERKVKDEKLLFILMVNKGICLLSNRKIEEALDLFNRAAIICNNASIKEWERADFYYIYALCNISSLNLYRALEYIKISQEYFSKESLFKRSIENTIVEANILKRLGQYRKVEQLFTSALKITQLLKDDKYIGIINQNLGDLYSKKGDHENAIKYYIESLKYKINITDKLIAVLSLIEENEKIENVKEILRWNDYGIKLIDQLTDLNIEAMFYNNCFQINEVIYKSNLSNKILELDLKFFEDFNYYHYGYKYATKIADLLSYDRKYKLSNYYYQIAIKNIIKENIIKGDKEI